jgi:succinoglycan biosynthesis protein ExoA
MTGSPVQLNTRTHLGSPQPTSDEGAVGHADLLRSAEEPLRASEVLVVLPALNEEQHLAACVRSLMTAREWMSQTTIVISDGGSRDATRRIAQELQGDFPNIRLVDNPMRLQSAAVNAAVEAAALPRHRVLVRCDVHAAYPSEYVRDVATAVIERGVASVVTPLDAIGYSAVQRAAAWVADTPLGSGGAAHRGGTRSGYVDHGHHAAFDLQWFRHLGGYDETFSHNEDAEYDVRVARAGGRIWLDATSRVSYLTRDTLSGLWRQYGNYGRGRARTVLKHRMKPRVRQLIPVINIGLLASSVAVGVCWWPGYLWCAVYASALLLVSVVCAVRLRSAAGLLAGPALATMHIAWGLGFLWQWGGEAIDRALAIARRRLRTGA